jgi:hypothetical protein
MDHGEGCSCHQGKIEWPARNIDGNPERPLDVSGLASYEPPGMNLLSQLIYGSIQMPAARDVNIVG